MPLGLFRIRAVSISVLATFLVGFGFFGAIIFLPRWLQTVGGASATESGFNLLPLVGGMIVAAISAGQIVARTHRYKVMMIASLALLAFGLFLMTNLTADTDRPVLWLWMVLAGIGIGPSLAVFTLVVQNAVAPQQIGAATSSVSFFQQIGGTIGLTIAGTVMGERFAQEVPVATAWQRACHPNSPRGSRVAEAGSISRAPATSASAFWRRCRPISSPSSSPSSRGSSRPSTTRSRSRSPRASGWGSPRPSLR